MRNTVFASAFALLGFAAAVPADAMPFPSLADQAPSAITLAAGGCGAGFHRGRMADADPTAALTGITRTPILMAGIAGGAAACASATDQLKRV